MLSLYTETAFQVTPPTAASVVNLQIPRANGSYDKSKFSSKKSGDGKAFSKDEQAYSSHILASQSSIYFRESKTYPRTFYWKVVNNGKVLEVQCADFARSEGDTKEAYMTLRFEFQDQIAPCGVTFADLNNSEEIHAFVCTLKNEIFNLCIPTNAFRNAQTLQDENLNQWCRPMESSTLSIDTVHRIYASSPLDVFISFAGGRIQRLRRASVQEEWQQTNYDDRSWGASIRGLVGRGAHMVEYGSTQLDPRTAQAMALSRHRDGDLLFTVCLNHTLRIWDLEHGRILATKDLLGLTRDANDRTHLNPAENALIQLFKERPSQNHPTVLTFSSRKGGQFKFWDIKESSTNSLSIEDKYPTVTLSPPDPDETGNTVWSMIGFRLDPGAEFKLSRLWVLWRNHNYHQLYNCQLEFGSIASSWKESNWVKCNPTASAKSPPPEFGKGDQEDAASKWLDFLFYPGRYSDTALETALSLFEQATAAKPTSSQKSLPLRQRLSSTIAANVSLRKYGESDMDFDRFSLDTDAQWRSFYRIAENINQSRNAPLALAYDAFSEMVWIALADKCCAVRECSKIELLQQNAIADVKDLEEVAARSWPHRKVSAEDGEPFVELAVLIAAARRFNEAFPADLAQDLALAIAEELWNGGEHITPARLLNIYDSVGFGDAVSNDVFERLESDLASLGGISGLNNELFLGLLELLVYKSKKSKSALRNTLFGNLLLSTGILDFLSAQRQLLVDLLALAIFVEGELSQEDAKSAVFDASELYDQIVPLLRLCERNLWLASHSRLVPLEILGTDGHPNAARHRSKATSEEKRLVSIFEDTLSKAVRPQPAVEKPLMYLITDQISEIDDWASGKDTLDPEEGPVFLQCDLLKQGELDLATDFLRYQPSTSWSSYVKGRLMISKGEYDVAAYYFRKASYGLACGKAVGNLVALSAGLLSLIETECFNNGIPMYLVHVMTLFETAKAYNEAAQFAHLALEALPPGQKEPVSNLRTEVLSRLLNAELRLSRYEKAYATLVQLSDPALQRSSVTALVDAILNPNISVSGPEGAVRTLESLPWAMYPHLARHLDQHLVSLSKNQSTPSVWAPGDSKLDYSSIMHAISLSQQDYRRAVTVLYDRLKAIRKSGRARHDPRGTALRHVLLALINLMACVAPEEAYIIVEIEDQKTAASGVNGEDHANTRSESDDLQMKKRRRVVITLDDLRKEYQAVLDKCSRIERGDFDFEVDGEEDDDDDENGDNTIADSSQSRLDLSKVSSRNGNGGDAMEF
jgi:nuclear pore complex protein Nup160